jgi:hypothetical protein
MAVEAEADDENASSLRPPYAAIVFFAAANVLIPLLCKELFPFSLGPMFSDRPQAYCTYRVLGPDGSELPPADFALHRTYDGDPPGFGGRLPAPSLDRFGVVPSREEVVAHVVRQLARKPDLSCVEVVQEVVGPVSPSRVGVVAVNRWRVRRGGEG